MEMFSFLCFLRKWKRYSVDFNNIFLYLFSLLKTGSRYEKGITLSLVQIFVYFWKFLKVLLNRLFLYIDYYEWSGENVQRRFLILYRSSFLTFFIISLSKNLEKLFSGNMFFPRFVTMRIQKCQNFIQSLAPVS